MCSLTPYLTKMCSPAPYQLDERQRAMMNGVDAQEASQRESRTGSWFSDVFRANSASAIWNSAGGMHTNKGKAGDSPYTLHADVVFVFSFFSPFLFVFILSFFFLHRRS